MLLVLPHKDLTFDHFRPPHTTLQLFQRHASGTAKLPVDLDPEFEIVIRTWDVEWGRPVQHPNASSKLFAEARFRKQLRRAARQKGGEGTLHWYVFDFDLIVQLFHCFAYEIQFI